MQKKQITFCAPCIGEEEVRAVADTLRSGWIGMGPRVRQFEEALKEYTGSREVVTVNSCTSGLHLSLIVSGVNMGHEVITTPYTWLSTANVINYVGARPVFVDIDENTLNIDPEQISLAITRRTRAILPVHYAGQPADMDRIRETAKLGGVETIIEDAAHAIGGRYIDGTNIGSNGNLTCFSFYANKTITTAEGGAIALNDSQVADRLRRLRSEGINRDTWKRYNEKNSWAYDMDECGLKYNMSDFQAALGIEQLKKLDEFVGIRRALAAFYDEALPKIPGVRVSTIRGGFDSTRYLYPIFLEDFDRSEFITKMKERGIGTGVHYIPLHLLKFYQTKFGYRPGQFPVAERVFSQEVSLPLHQGMSREDAEYVVESVKEILHR